MPLDSKLTIGQRIELSVGVDWLVTRLEEHDDSGTRLVVGWPTDRQRRLVPLKAGDSLQIAATSTEDALYSAPARVERANRDAALPMLVLMVLGDWQRSQRRNAVRVPVVIRPRVVARIEGENSKALRAGITNLSANGVQVRSQDEIKLGDMLNLAFSVMGIEEEIEVQARVRRVMQHERGTMHLWEAGCEMQALPPRIGQKIVQFIFSQQRAQARNRRGA
jgi:c-di-GMP-binding flagellar brake protein YcgR